MRIGVLAMQGAFREHIQSLEALGVQGVEIRHANQLEGIAGLIIPGGESTTIGKLMVEFNLLEPVRHLAEGGLPVFGTCAGMVLLAREITGSDQPRLGLMNARVQRNAFGRQVDSFEVDLEIPALGAEPFHAVFIRAPYIEEIEPPAEALATFKDKIVMARQGNILATAFHPELTEDLRVHRYFLEMIK
ncbi:MAG: pyridoxal 5-phosphate synthase pdxT subunit [Moorella sp. (in: firmicutes)]|uniref:Pyridoxal 5'-phosphate synthase subunit PdxT n=1 Tax=Neomoorella thermoacetica TaxID=1525 RepID=A0A1J5P0M8_NEOTH|nr:pyridoxal 5-phosphate synthase pdxT subunit [Moorella sp. (in: firmicutes)]OIQ59131.1 glutamine amidotransferase subunit PdxT [Moorella thermoacetica]